MTDYLILGVAAFVAGFVDAVVGGGGLVQLPALFTVYPSAVPSSLLGTSKLAGVWGTSVAAFNYLKSVKLNWSVILPGAIAAFLLSFLGAITVTYIPPTWLRMALPFVLAAIAVYTFANKDFGIVQREALSLVTERKLTVLFGALIGFYDGFFGPGTGSFFVFVFVRFLGYSFLSASAAAKVLNVACNAAALIWFGVSGNIMVALGLSMAVCGVFGSLLGSNVAIRFGSAFVRKVFLLIVVCLIAKTAYDGFLR